jgi:hypothetical protein
MALGLSLPEALIAVNGPEKRTTPSNEIGEVFEPIGRGGYREF